MEDLKNEYQGLTPTEFLSKIWSTSTKNAAANLYFHGAADALRGAGLITLEEYDFALAHVEHTPSKDLIFG